MRFGRAFVVPGAAVGGRPYGRHGPQNRDPNGALVPDSPSSRLLRGGLVLLVIAAAVGAFYLSYGALYELAVAAGGIPPERAWVFPLIVDLPVVAATLIAVLLPDTSRALTWVTFWVFIVATVAGNAVHVFALPASSLALGVWPAVVISAVPPIALAFTAHLAVHTVFTRHRSPVAAGLLKSVAHGEGLDAELDALEAREPVVIDEEQVVAEARALLEANVPMDRITEKLGVPREQLVEWIRRHEQLVA